MHPENQENRSENLLPADDAAEDEQARFEVAEEVNLDQQSDGVRHLGNLPDDASEAERRAVQESLKPTS